MQQKVCVIYRDTVNVMRLYELHLMSTLLFFLADKKGSILCYYFLPSISRQMLKHAIY